MEPWVWMIIGLLIGFVCGYGISVHLRAKTFAGTLRMDQSDPTEAPYLFLELDPDGMRKINRFKTVVLRVKLENYIPRN